MALPDAIQPPSAAEPKRVLLVPISGPAGSGELQRCLILANALARPGAGFEPALIVNRHAPLAAGVSHRVFPIETSPTHSSSQVIAALREFRPAVTVFDGTARLAQLRAARAGGSATVFIIARPSGRRKILDPRRLRRLDQVWLTQPPFLERPRNLFEQLLLRLARPTTIHTIGPVFEPPDPERARRTLDRYGLQPDGYAVFCLGLAVQNPTVRHAMAAFEAVAQRLAAATGLKAVVIGGDPALEPRPVGVIGTPLLPNAELVDLLAQARLAFTNGGSLLLQAMALGTVCVALPTNGDQPARIAACVRRGLVLTAAPDAEALLQQVMPLLQSPTGLDTRRAVLKNEELGQGTLNALQRLRELVGRPGG